MIQGIEWQSIEDKSFLFGKSEKVKYLFKSGNSYGYYNKEDEGFHILLMENEGKYPTHEMFQEHGIENLENLPQELIGANLTVLQWSDKERSDVLLERGVPIPRIAYTINKQSHTRTEKVKVESDNVKFLISTDKENWKRHTGTEWEDISPEDIEAKGMGKNAINGITQTQWKSLGKNFYVGMYFRDEVMVEYIDFARLVSNVTPMLSNVSIYLLNTKATIQVKTDVNRIELQVTDEDKGRVQYRMLVNGKQVMPKDGEFTELELDAKRGFFLSEDDIIVGEENQVEVQFQDAWGSTDSWKGSFEGKSYGIYFEIERKRAVTNEGEVLIPLEVEVGTEGLEKEYEFTLTNVSKEPIHHYVLDTFWSKGEVDSNVTVEIANTKGEWSKVVYETSILHGEANKHKVRVTSTSTLEALTDALESFNVTAKAYNEDGELIGGYEIE